MHNNNDTSSHPNQRTTGQENPLNKIPLAYKKGKSGEQLNILLTALLDSHQQNGNYIYLGKNTLGTEYLIINHEVLFFNSPTFQDRLKAFAVKQLGLIDISNTAIKNTISVLNGSPEFWAKDDSRINTPSVRVINNGFPNIWYYWNPKTPIHLSTFPSDTFLRGGFGILNPDSAIWPTNLPHHDMFNYNYREAVIREPESNLSNLFQLLKQTGIAQKHQALVITWLVHSLMSNQYLMLNLIGDSTDARRQALSLLKHLIDPSEDCFRTLPKKIEDIASIGLEEYLLTFDSVKNLSETQQQGFLELMINTGVKVSVEKTLRGKRVQCFVKRPILISSEESSISNSELRSRTLTIDIEDAKSNHIYSTSINNVLVDRAREELLLLATMSSPAISEQKITECQFDKNYFPEMKEFISLGLRLGQILEGNYKIFLDKFMEWATEDQFNHLDNNDTAYLLYLWAKTNLGRALKLSIKDWKQELAELARENGLDWERITPRKIGADFKQAKPVLAKMGIQCTSTGKASRFVEWSVTVENKIGNSDAIKSQIYNGNFMNRIEKCMTSGWEGDLI